MKMNFVPIRSCIMGKTKFTNWPLRSQIKPSKNKKNRQNTFKNDLITTKEDFPLKINCENNNPMNFIYFLPSIEWDK